MKCKPGDILLVQLSRGPVLVKVIEEDFLVCTIVDSNIEHYTTGHNVYVSHAQYSQAQLIALEDMKITKLLYF